MSSRLHITPERSGYLHDGGPLYELPRIDIYYTSLTPMFVTAFSFCLLGYFLAFLGFNFGAEADLFISYVKNYRKYLPLNQSLDAP